MDSNSGDIVYETLDPLSFFADTDTEPAESYAVFRNQITSSADPSADIPVADYFSLDVAAAADETPTARREVEDAATPSLPSADSPAAANGGGSSATELAWFRAGSRFRSPMIQLHKEIIDFADFVSPTPEEQASRAAAVQSVFEVVKYIWPQCRVEVFGSFRTGLYLPTSDIDAVILESKVKTPQMGLYALARALTQRNIAKKIQVIAKARVPIIKFVEKRSGMAFDISFDIDGGPKAADFIKDAVQKLPPLRPLCLVLKVFLQQRELNEVYSGGVGSYTLLAMLIAHLQMQWRGQDLQMHPQAMEHNLGILLVNFFDFYGRKLNTSDVGVSCTSSGTFYLKTDKGFVNTERPYLLSVQDPQAEDNDIGRNSFNFFKVRSAFSMAYSFLTDAKKIIGLGSRRSILGTIIRPDPVLLNRKGGNNGALSFTGLLPGADEPAPQQFDNESSIIYNWQLLDEDPLPRGKSLIDEENPPTGKRRASKSLSRSGKCDREQVSKTGHEENGSTSRLVDARKKRQKAFREDDDRVHRSLPRSKKGDREEVSKSGHEENGSTSTEVNARKRRQNAFQEDDDRVNRSFSRSKKGEKEEASKRGHEENGFASREVDAKKKQSIGSTSTEVDARKRRQNAFQEDDDRVNRSRSRSKKGEKEEASKRGHEENGFASREVDAKKKRSIAYQADDDGFSRSLPQNWSRSH